MNLWQDICAVLASGLEFGLLNSLTVVGLALAFRFANFPDLTVEGTVTISAAASATGLVAGMSPVASLLLGAFVGAFAGLTTASLHLLTRMSRLLASIIMMTVLYALSLRLMHGSNLSLYGLHTLYESSAGLSQRCFRSISVIVPLVVLLGVFLHTEFGLILRANGENESLVRKLGRPCWLYLCVTLALANFMVGLSGAMVAHYNQFADVGFGAGTIVTGLAALLLGEAILIPTSVTRQLIAAIIGSIVYFTIFALALKLGLHPWDLKLVSGVFILAAIVATKSISTKDSNKRIGCDPL